MKKIIFILLLIINTLGLQAQYKNVQIATTNVGYPPCEPSICINPTNPDNIVAGSILDWAYTSMDGGKTWETQRLSSEYGVWGDPCIVADNEGNFYYFHLSATEMGGWETRMLDRIVCQRSEDGGQTWTDGTGIGEAHPKDQDKEWAVFDPTSGEIYITWTQFDKYGSEEDIDKSHILFSKSGDKGETWTEPVAINQLAGDCIDDDQTVEGAVPAAGLDGEIYVAWSYDEKIYFDKSLDGGETWLDEDIFVAEQPQGWSLDIPGVNRCNGMPVTCVDMSDGPNQGTIYINWADQRNGVNDTDIWLKKSTDGGNTWSEPIRVNDDPTGKHQFLTWMSVDPITGYIHIIFYDRRDQAGKNTDVYWAYSKDGGETFTNKKISEAPFLNESEAFFGDYNNISAFDGKVRPIWTRQEGYVLSIWTALIELE